MHYRYPTPEEAGIRIPAIARREMFRAGFRHGLQGGSLDCREHLRFSFRMGVRAAKIYARRLRRERGILDFPQRWRIRIRARFDA